MFGGGFFFPVFALGKWVCDRALIETFQMFFPLGERGSLGTFLMNCFA